MNANVKEMAVEVYPIGILGLNGYAIQHIAPAVPTLCGEAVKKWLASNGVVLAWPGNNYGYSDRVWINVRPADMAIPSHAADRLIDRKVVTVSDDEAAWLGELDFSHPGSAGNLRHLRKVGL